MKSVNIIIIALAAICSTISCIVEVPVQDSLTSPDEEYVRLKLSSSNSRTASVSTRATWSDDNGAGNMAFKWEKTDTNDNDISNLSLIISDGSKALRTWGSPDTESDSISWSHTWMSVSPLAHNTNYADFLTTRYYFQEDLKEGKYCFAVAGNTELCEEEESGRHLCHIGLPSVFRQQKSQDPSFLREYMYMYSDSEYKGESTSLKFKHIPTMLRLIVTNIGSDTTSFNEVSFYVSDSSASDRTEVASSGAELAFDWESGLTELTFSESYYDTITTIIEGADSTLAVDSSYIAYAMVMPLPDNNALQGKLLNFNIRTSGSGYLSYQLNADKIALANEGIYNWIGGKSYTIRLDLGDTTSVRGRVIEDNVIELIATVPGTYTLKYEDKDKLPLSNFTDICTLTVNDFAYYKDFMHANSAPREAEHMGIYDQDGERWGSVSMAGFKPEKQTPLYSIGMLSDVHCEDNQRTESISDFKTALNFFRSREVAMTCICGDITQNGTKQELSIYRQLVNAHSSMTPVYTTSGNHDCPEEGLDEELWMQYTKQPLVFEESVTLPDGSTDHFLFLGMSYWSFAGGYLTKNINWLGEKLEEYKNERCFVITHLFFPDRAGNLNGIYLSNNWLKEEQLDKLQGMCDRYVNSIWFSGHSHWKWELQRYQDRANIYRRFDENGAATSGWCVHIPSCAQPIDSDGTTRVGMPLESQGSIIHVYKDRIELLGIDFKTKKYFPIASYSLDTKIQEVEEIDLSNIVRR